MINKSFITFIIPTIGRESLINSINSLIMLNDNDWKAIIIFDGVKNNLDIKDSRIKIIEIEKNGIISKKNNAGLVRNIGIKNIDYETEWIGFLDDDDYVSPEYISNLKEEIKQNNNIEVCIFRMIYENGCILPSKFDKNITRCKVGISFTIKKYITDKFFFINNPFEDYLYLKELEKNKYKIIISSHVSYFVKTKPYKIIELFPKILIN
jgi:GT2 family glycosyltransferase